MNDLTMISEVYLSLGSNLGDRAENVKSALEALDNIDEINVVASSSFYETEPVGVTEQPKFINAAAKVETSLGPRELLKKIKSTEAMLGRAKTFRWGPRIIDIDILLFGDLVMSEKGLEIPHREMKERTFVMVPLSEIGYGVVHPLTGKTIGEEASGLSDLESIKKWE